ncbi:hypothetical protein KY289_001224 [Solanum tuberosum]|nr:hypothetical protein KY289_001224 [Solanum tuberosum]
MLKRVIEYEGAIVEFADRDIGMALHLKFVDIVDKNSTDFIMPRIHGSNARSPVWNHYEKLEEKEDGSWIVKCIHCSRVTYYHSHNIGIASLRRHVKRCLESKNQNRQLSRIDD